MNSCILIHLAVGTLSAIFGYLLGRLFTKGDCQNCKDWKEKIISLEKELNTSKKKSNKLSKSSITATPKSTLSYPFNASLAKSVFGENDLTIVEGIGPKIQELFNKNNIKSWKSLSNCSAQKCQSILDKGGEAYRIHKPGTWPKQARMAYEGKWEKLLKWQNELDRGK
mgnify:CR=1 FL=1